MRGFKALCTALVCGGLLATAAHAADPPEKSLTDIFKLPRYQELVSGWYVRGDIGYRNPSIESVETALEPVTAFRFPAHGTIGFGGGYKYQWFRADMTLDYGLRTRFAGDTALGVNYYAAKIDAITVLANVYLDLGTWGGFTPYVGAGGGATQLRTDELSINSATPVATGSKWNPSWALMGGVAYQFMPNMVLDVGYRYLYLGDAVSGPETIPATGLITFRNISAHEIRLGFRLLLD